MADQRSRLIIKRHFQRSMILEILLITFLLINLIVIVGYLLIDSISDIQQLKHYLGFAVAGLEAVGFVLVYRYNLKASHRIAGPLFVIERNLKLIQAGDLSFTMRLRQGDRFHEVKDQFNLTLSDLKQRIAKAQQLAAQLQASSGNDQAVADELVQALAHFKVEPEVEEDKTEKQGQHP